MIDSTAKLKDREFSRLRVKLRSCLYVFQEDEMKTINETEDDTEKPELHKAFAKFAQKSNGQVK